MNHKFILMKNSITLIFLAFLAFSCIKEEDPNEPPQQDQLPPITQTGAYTFGCLLDGEVWLPKHYSNSIINPPVVLQAALDSWNGNLFQVTANHKRKDDNSIDELIALYTFPDIIRDTAYFDDSDTGRIIRYNYSPFRGGPLKRYKTISSKSSWVYLSRFDTISRIASGTFSAVLINKDDNSDTVRIREGRFDVPF